jgi:polysaccharide export outer membrane protein
VLQFGAVVTAVLLSWSARGQSVSTQTGGGTASAPSSSTSNAAANLLSGSRSAAVAAQPASAAATGSLGAPANYQLSVNDQIGVEVFGEDDLRTNVRVNSDGNVSLPLLGPVRLAGLTIGQASARLTEMYGRDYLVNPKVNVSLIGYAKRRFTVLGQVGHPGSFEMPEGSPGGIDLLEAIAMAGGYTRIAAPERITVRRGDKVVRVDAKKLAKRQGEGFVVEPGDTITVGESIF